ncbi:hypothetical protein AWV72_p011 (plasmid) [Lactiplantibacillus plantarum]|uniref:HNH endonuclease signature motif containing protein n=1 Tax=Lactiplantibacillus plantarum TaxID=1590 RepID=UPI00083FB4BB|nr:HNH endonuclease signature motif containing protein [Lactiplantibacillus plantarum]AOG30845.1 hypothetical protein AWV72_p011 [Lactiplantibacillus plantarum]
MDIHKLDLKELLFLYMNVKGYKLGKVLKRGDKIPDSFSLETTIRSGKASYKGNDISSSDFEEMVSSLNKYYDFQELKFSLHSSKIKLTFNNDHGITLSKFMTFLFDEINKRQLAYTVKDFSKYFAIAAFGFRGSLDFKAKFYTIDIHSSRLSSKKDVEQLMKLVVLSNLDDQLNFNFRELQKQGTVRDTQFRINLRYFYNNYLNDLKNINPLRYNQLIINKELIMTMKIKDTKKGSDDFLKRLLFYSNHVIESKGLNDLDIVNLRQMLNFSNQDDQDSGKKRSNKAKELAIINSPNFCAACHNMYETKDRTFKIRETNNWYFEMHHVISFANKNLQTESPDNYVKLCPACHRALTPGRADEEYQKELISNILDGSDNNSRIFVMNIQNEIHDHKETVEFVYELLK